MTRRDLPPRTSIGRLRDNDASTADDERFATNDAGGAMERGDLTPGSLVGKYIVEERRSRGGFATIYRVHHETLGRIAAVKVLHKHLSRSPVCVKRFIQEAQAVNLIGHPNIVDIYEFGELTDGRPYYVMDWLEGRDLDEELRAHGPFAATEALFIIERVAVALAAAHRVGVVHRDLKAANVFFVPLADGRFDVKLVDFGIAKLLTPPSGASLTSTGARLGTPWTMAPEQILGEPVDERADVYAVGVLLYQLLTGQYPFFASTAVEVEELHLYATPPRASDVAAVSPRVDAVIQRCLEKRREQRFSSIDEFLTELRAVQAMPARGKVERLPAVAVHVLAHLPTDVDEFDDALLDAVDEVMQSARSQLVEQQLTLVVDSATALLAVALLPAGETDAQERRARLVGAAGEIDARAASARAHLAGLGFSVVVHAAPVVVRRCGERVDFVGGELLDVAQWSAARDQACVTSSALAGLERRFATAPLASHPHLRRLLAPPAGDSAV